MGNTNEASKADLNKGIIGVFRLCHFDRMLLHGCRLLSSVPCAVPHFMGALYRFKSAKSIAKTAKFRSRFLPHFRQQHQVFSALFEKANIRTNKLNESFPFFRVESIQLGQALHKLIFALIFCISHQKIDPDI